MKNYKIKRSGFTLVELIVVISILAILGTIAFLSFGGFTNNARDSKRISDISVISNWLWVYNATSMSYPLPDDWIKIFSWTEVIWYQWYIWDNVSRIIKISSNTKDPLDWKWYTYLVNSKQDKYEVMALLENNNSISLNEKIIPIANAIDNIVRIPFVAGYRMWIVVYQTWTSITPVHELTNTWFDITTAWIWYNAIIWSKEDSIKDLSYLLTSYERPIPVWWIKKITAVTSETQDWQILFWVANKLNVFKKNGLDITIINVEKWTDTLLMANQVDVKVGWTASAVWVYLNNQEMRLLATVWRNFVHNIYSRFPITNTWSIHKIAISKSWVEPHYKLIWTLKSIWVDTKNLTSVIISDETTRYQMLKNWEIDATNNMTYWIYPKDSWLYPILTDDKKVNWYNFPTAILTNQFMIDNKSEELSRFVVAIFETIDYMKKHKEETKQIIKEKYSTFTEEDLEYLYSCFIKTLDWETYIPDISSFESDRWLVQEIALPVNPTRDLKDFVNSKFTKDALIKFPMK